MKHTTINTLLVSLLLMPAYTVLPLHAQDKPTQQEAVRVERVVLTVTDSNGEPMPGAAVLVDNKPRAVTDVEGRVSLVVPRGSWVEVRYVGSTPWRRQINATFSGTVTLENETSELDQVVVTGYQRTTKRRTTGSIATVTAKDLEGNPTAGLDMLLQGKIAGVDVKAVSGRPGQTATVRIRGTNTITGNADPLWVVDGVPLQRDIPAISSTKIRAGDFNDIFSNGIAGINPNDIESVTVLKDASAAAIYGSRAAGGVVVVTTKRGKEGQLRLNYSANVSVVSAPPSDANLMTSKEKLAWEQELWDEFSARGFAEGSHYPVVGVVGQIRSGFGRYAGMSVQEQDAEIARLGSQSTDWFKELFRNSVSHSHYLSLSGGSQKSAYYLSMGYNKYNGLVKKTDYERYNVSAKLDLKPNRRVKFGFQTDLAYQIACSPSLNVNPFKYAYFANPYERVYDDNGDYAADNTYFTMGLANGEIQSTQPTNGYNIFREINETSSKTKNLTATLIATLNVQIMDHLSFEGLASFGYVHDAGDNINGKDTYAAWTDRVFEGSSFTSKRTYGSITQTSAMNTNYDARAQLHYSNTFAKHHYLSALAGAELRGSYAKSIFEKRYGYDPVTGNSAMPVYPENTNVDYVDLLSYASIIDQLSGQSIEESAFASFYFSLDYVLRQRYVLSVTARTDGSNNFGSEQQFNPTGSVGLSWNLDQERFMKKLQPYVSSASLRAAFGYTGNINKTVYPQFVMDYSSDFRRTGDEYYRMGYIRNAPNPNLRWEKTRDMKVSLDMGLFKERLRFQVELYDRRTRDAVTAVPVPYTTGFYVQSYNTSELLNQGAEFSISSQLVKTRDWRLSLTANLAYNRNKLLKYDIPNPGIFNDNCVGYPLNALISGKVQGIDPATGLYTYQLRDDVVLPAGQTTVKSDDYAFYLGTANAPVNGGYSIHLAWKELSLSIGGSYSLGGKIFNEVTPPQDYGSLSAAVNEHPATIENDLYVNHFNVTKDAVNRWTPQNSITNGRPRIVDAYGESLGLDNTYVTASSITRASMLENVSYFKLGSIMLSYSFPQKNWMKRAHLSSLSLSFTLNNVFIVTNYSGIDPETPGAVYPMPRTYTMGVSVGI